MSEDTLHEPVAVGAQLRLLGAAPPAGAALAALALVAALLLEPLSQGRSVPMAIYLAFAAVILYRVAAGAACGVLCLAAALIVPERKRSRVRGWAGLAGGLVLLEGALLVAFVAAVAAGEAMGHGTSGSEAVTGILEATRDVPEAFMKVPLVALLFVILAVAPGVAAAVVLRDARPPGIGTRPTRLLATFGSVLAFRTLLPGTLALGEPRYAGLIFLWALLAGLCEGILYCLGLGLTLALAPAARRALAETARERRRG